MDFPFLEREFIEGCALDLCREAFGEVPLGEVNLDALVYDYLYEEFGVAIYRDRPLGADGKQDILGITYPLRNEIHIDSRLAESGHRGRYRFTVAHEIGHWVLHRPLFLEAVGECDDVRMITLERDVVSAEKSYRPEEWQANYFAIHLLLNDRALERAFERRFEEKPLVFKSDCEVEEGASLRDYSRGIASMEEGDLGSLSDYFGLSVEATAIALEERGYVEERSEG